MRLLVFALLSELPFNLMVRTGQWLSLHYQNVLWTLLTGALVCWCRGLGAAPADAGGLATAGGAPSPWGSAWWQLAGTDYRRLGRMLLVVLFYAVRRGSCGAPWCIERRRAAGLRGVQHRHGGWP